MTDNSQTREQLIDKLRNELYANHGWSGETAVNYMVPIILATRHLDDEESEDSIHEALKELRHRGKMALGETLLSIRDEYRDVSPLLQKTLGGMINDVTDLPTGTIDEILDYLDDNPTILQAFRDEDFIGTLFERSVSDAFRGDDGRFFTPKNIILVVREMTRLLETSVRQDLDISELTVCDPCCGSARFLIYWSELIIDDLKRDINECHSSNIRSELRRIATKNLFGADVHRETAAYGCLNMMLHGDGATNISNLNSLNHFGIFTDMPLLTNFSEEFETKWDEYTSLPGVSGADLQLKVELIETKRDVISDFLEADELNISNEKWLDFLSIIEHLLDMDREYSTGWETIRDIQRRSKLPPVFKEMVGEWSKHNHDISNGFDVLITNPPFGRQSDLMIDDIYILSQYKLATELWVGDLTKTQTENLLSRTLANETGISLYYIDLLNEHFNKQYIEANDEVHFKDIKSNTLNQFAESHNIDISDLNKEGVVSRITEALGRVVVQRSDNIELDEILSSKLSTVCSSYLFDSHNPGEILINEIKSYFGKEWLTVEDIKGEEGFKSKSTLVFNDEPHTIYYDDADKPIVFKNSLPKQVLFIEQFLRMVKPGGKVFTVMDTGVLSNIGDEYVSAYSGEIIH
ncbi:MAG: N-6 DNA methylase [Anaerolineales bacterium]